MYRRSAVNAAHSQPPAVGRPQRRWRIGPAFTLVLLAPVVVELLYGAVRVSTIFVLIPEFMTWGCGALLIRECIRRWRKDWQSMLLMGLALAVAEEWVIQQTSISPLVGIGQHAYGRAWGVNWVYFLWALGYESVWVVLLPVQLTELLFPDRRAACWLRTRGLVIAGVFFALGVFVAWYGWTQRARVKIFHMAPYGPPPAYLLTGIVAILALIVAAYALPLRQTRERNAVSHASPSPWTIGWGTCALGSGWAIFFLLGWGVGVFPTVPFAPVLAAALAWALVTFLLMRRWTSGVDWGDAHRFAIVFGGVMACMIGGFVIFKVDGALLIDWIGKAILNLAALAGLIALALRVRRRKRSNTQA